MGIKNLRELKKLYFDGFPEDSEKDAREFFKTVKSRNCVFLEDAGRIISAGYIIEKPAYLFNKKTNLQFISALATKKELRGQGIIGTVLGKMFELLRSRGEFFCALHPFLHEYYKRHGFCTVSFCDELKSGETAKNDFKSFADNYLLKPKKEFFKGLDFSGKTKEYAMGRIIDVKSAFLSAPYTDGFTGNRTFSVTDGIIPSNNASFKVTVNDGKAEVETVLGFAGEKISIAELTALLLLGDGIFIKKQVNVFPDKW